MMEWIVVWAQPCSIHNYSRMTYMAVVQYDVGGFLDSLSKVNNFSTYRNQLNQNINETEYELKFLQVMVY